MSKKIGRKKLACFVAHEPHMESCLPILDRVAHRGKVDVHLHLNRRLLRNVHGLQEYISSSPVIAHIQSRTRIELFSYLDFRRADAVLSYGDPLALKTKIRLRDKYLVASGKPCVFVQHGLIQEGVNIDSPILADDWYSSLILWWARQVQSPVTFLSQQTLQKVQSVGFLKKNLLLVRDFSSKIQEQTNKYKKIILVCTSIPQSNYRFSDSALQDLYNMLDQFCARNPSYLVLLRSHRARKSSIGFELSETRLLSRDNVMVMDRHSGQFAGSTIHDSLALCDIVIGHASTAILDAIYADKPTAVLQNDSDDLADMVQIGSLQDMEQFVESAHTHQPRSYPVRQRFGELEQNLDLAAEHIERLMLQGAPE